MGCHGTTLQRRYALGAALAVGLMLWLGPGVRDVEAGTLAELQLQASAAKLRPAAKPRMELCVGAPRGANCGAAFESALRASAPESSANVRLYEAVAAHLAPAHADPDLHGHLLALKFNEDPEWQRRAKALAHEGLPFVRMPQGVNHELIVGITPRGMLGFQLKDTRGE